MPMKSIPTSVRTEQARRETGPRRAESWEEVTHWLACSPYSSREWTAAVAIRFGSLAAWRALVSVCRAATETVPMRHVETTCKKPVIQCARVLKDPQTATIPSPHSLAAILSPSAPPEDPIPSGSRSTTPKRTHAEAFHPSEHRPYLHPASPTQHRPNIASQGEPSPGTYRADDGSGGVMRGGQPEEKKPQKMVRSSIACARCRRSKVKCVNNGVHSTCKACAQSNRECTYPVAGSAPAPRRAEAAPGIKQEGDSDSKKRIRKVEDSGRRNSGRIGEDVLESPILTRKVWDELYEIFKMHFSTEMPFLHPPTFRNRMRQASFPRDPAIPAADLEDGKVLLLGVLTLTARFHPVLVAHHSPNGEDPLAASEYYAAPLAASFGPTIRNLTTPSLENIQGLLMLGLYEWGQTRGLSAWLYIGLAIRLAFPLGLAYIDDAESQVFVSSPDVRKGKLLVSPREDAIEKEVRRRTLWSCFIMDRMLAAGKDRPVMINVEKLPVQLPCSDDQFLFVHNVQTGFLGSNGFGRNQLSAMTEDGVLSRYIRLVEIFGNLSEWSYAGGRRTERLPPWNEKTGFYKLRRQLKEFHDALPPSLTFTEANLSAHLEKRNATTYASLHTLYSLCLIVLHREYIPFIPIRCEKPCGPLDAPTFPPDKYEIPEGFWEESAEGIMKAARDIIDIVSTCQDNDALPESPQFGFAVWQAAFVAVYALWFPQMDLEGHLVDRSAQEHPKDMRSKGKVALTEKILRDMVPRLKMVKGYLKSIGKMHQYFYTVHRDYNVKFRRSGGGLEQYKLIEKELKEFGDLKDNDHALSEGSDPAEHNRSRASTNDIGTSVNGEPMQGVESAQPPRPNGAWAAVNAASPPAEDDRYKYAPHNQHPYGMPGPGSYQQSPGQTSTTPSLIPSNNGDSTPGLNSPYNPSPNPNQYPSHAANFPSIAQHTMPPPNLATPDESQFKEWISGQESISMNTGFDNFGQGLPMESFSATQFPGAGVGMQGHNPNFIQAAWAGGANNW